MNGRSRNQNWIYIFALVGVLVGIYFIYQLLTAGLQAYLALIAGVMLLIGNGPELVRTLQQRQFGITMLNTLVALALITYFLGTIIFTPLFWSLAILMLLAAAPLTLNRVGVARAYINGARSLFTQVRGLLRLRSRTF